MSSKVKKPLKPGRDLLSAPGFFRRLAAQLYDIFLLVAVLFVATALLLPFTTGAAVSDQQLIIYRIYLVIISFFFYGWFWTHGGQTLGLRAWKIKVLTLDQ
ncbi:MAG: RDD family protein, partial [Methylococcaceae bacterium]